MLEVRHVLVPVDFHEHSQDLADLAVSMAKKLGAEKLTFIHVMQPLPDYSDYRPEDLKQVEAIFIAHAEGKMTAFMTTVSGWTSDANGVVVSGRHTADAIITHGRDQGADLIIIATHGSQGMEKVLLGSVADRVIKGASCPVLVFNPYNKKRGYDVCKPLNSCIQSV
jgi:nucleotide-binding universal stress UspA family protein